MEKLKKIAHVLNRIFKVLQGISLGCASACGVLLLIAAVLPEGQYSRLVGALDSYNFSVGFGTVALRLTQPLTVHGSLRLYVCVTLASAAVLLVLSWFGCRLLRRILTPMAESRPFDSAVSVNLRSLGWLSLIGIACSYVLSTVLAILELRLFDYSELFREGMVTGYTLESQFELTYLLFPVLLFLLSYVFRYGEELQKLSDETL